MKKYLFFIICLTTIISASTFAQPSLQWMKNYNGPVNGTDRINDADFDAVTGNIYVTGVSDSTVGFNYVTIKYSSEGQVIWRKRYSGPQYQDSPNAIKYDMVNNAVYVTGKSKGQTTNYDWLTIRYNASTGDTVWTKRYNGSRNSDDEAIDLDIDASGNIYVLGNVLEPCNSYLTTKLIKYSPTGNITWAKSIDPGYWCEYAVLASKLAVNGNKAVVIYNESSDGLNYYANAVGYYISDGACTTGYWCNSISLGVNSPEPGSYGIAFDGLGYVYICGNGVRKISTDVSSLLWVNSYSEYYSEWGHTNNIVVDQNNYFVYVTGYSGKSNGIYDIITTKRNALGDSLWSKRFIGAGNGDDRGLFITKDNLSNPNIFVTGFTTQTSGKKQITTIKYDTNGNQLWSVDYGCSANDNVPVGMFRDPNNNLYIAGYNDCNSSSEDYLTLKYCASAPAQPGAITGSTIVCGGKSQTYSISPVTGAISYTWTLPSGWSGTSITTSIAVTAGTSGGNVSVVANGSICSSPPRTLAVTINNGVPSNAGTISGNTTVCQGQSSVNYTVPAITNATSYIWTLPDGVTGTSTTNSINANFGMSAVSGGIEVYGQNICGNGSPSVIAVLVNPFPAAAGTISGPAIVCQGQNSATYTVPAIANATSYIWTLPGGASGTSSTNSILVNYAAMATSGDITVKGRSGCGDGASSTLAVAVNPLPTSAGAISGTTIVCQGQNSLIYAVPTISNATSYIWTLPDGSTGTSSTKTIVVSYGTSAVSGNVTVRGNNSCGDGTTSTLAITVNSKPTTPVITFNNNILHSNFLTGNQWYNQIGLIKDAIDQEYTVFTNGDYFVIVTANGCSSEPSNTIQITNLGIDLTKNNLAINVYPNPVTNELIIEIDGNIEIVNFEILNSIGQVVFKGNLIEKTVVQTNGLTPGLYLIKLENGKTFEFKKIVKN